ncbi:MAG: hypothetical protein WD557_00920 [Dehalococcoidia bacterium]
MTEGQPLAGKVVAIVGTGSEMDRAIAVACAEAGADIALGTESGAREHEYGMNSIANEIWAIGREHFARVLKGQDEAPDLVREARERLRGCDALVYRLDLDEVDGVPVVAPANSGEATVAAVLERLGD